MPLVHIHVVEGRRTREQLRGLCDAVQQVMRDEFAAPAGDRYQLLTEHRSGTIRVEDSGLGYTRTEDVVVIAITQQGRTTAQKQAMFAAMARTLHDETGLFPDDLVISVTENTPQDWSFGRGLAQFLDGSL
jgi:phenylpyruvate tautomerase PptA (4-oxalocrotonate tautomerase family)